MNVTVDLTTEWVRQYGCVGKIGLHATVKTPIEVRITDAGFSIIPLHGDSSYDSLTANGATGVEHCPGQHDRNIQNGQGDLPINWEVTGHLPATGWVLAASQQFGPRPQPDNGQSRADHYSISWELTPIKNFVCGPDVTAKVKNVLLEIETFFNGLSDDDKVNQCETLHGTPVTAQHLRDSQEAWDINQFYWETLNGSMRLQQVTLVAFRAMA